jgi:hypothetical protein
MLRTKITAIVGALGMTGLALTAITSLGVATASPAQANGPCRYQVAASSAYLRENPDTDSVVRKTKYRGDIVTGPCDQELDTESGVLFTAIDCSCASDLIGWIRTSQLD